MAAPAIEVTISTCGEWSPQKNVKFSTASMSWEGALRQALLRRGVRLDRGHNRYYFLPDHETVTRRGQRQAARSRRRRRSGRRASPGRRPRGKPPDRLGVRLRTITRPRSCQPSGHPRYHTRRSATYLPRFGSPRAALYARPFSLDLGADPAEDIADELGTDGLIQQFVARAAVTRDRDILVADRTVPGG